MAEYITPNDYDLLEVDRMVRLTLQELVDQSEKLFKKTYAYWKDKPGFQTTQTTGQDWIVEYKTQDTPYVFVDDGTEPHPIQSKTPGGFLSFKTGGTPRTRKGSLQSTRGNLGDTWVRKQQVQHPGIEPRDFSGQIVEVIDEKAEKTFDKNQRKLKTI